MSKKCKEKDLIWHMACEMVKKQGRAGCMLQQNLNQKYKIAELWSLWNLSKLAKYIFVIFGNFATL